MIKKGVNKVIRPTCFLVLALTLVTSCVFAAEESSEPDLLGVLRSCLHDRALFESKVRAFDKLHMLGARAAYVEAQEQERAGNVEAAKAASDRAQAKLQLVKSAYDLGLEHFEDSAVLLNFYGELVHDFFGRTNEAAQHWNRAVQLDSSYARAHGNIGMYCLHGGMYAAGLSSMDRAMELEPRNPDHAFNLAQAYLVHFPQIMQIRKWDRAKVYREAMKLSEKAFRLSPRDFDLAQDYAMNFFAAESFGVKSDWHKAAKAWQSARALARTNAERFNALLNEARVHVRGGDKRRARACISEARTIWPDSPAAAALLDDIEEHP